MRANGTIRYTEMVCGTKQVVDPDLPADAIASVRSGEGADALARRYLEPVAAMQDDDLRFPDPVEFAYYAIYNYFLRYALHEEIDDWLLVNQALASNPDEETWSSTLARAIEGGNLTSV